MICARCHRPLHRPPTYAAGMPLGPRCAALVAGYKPQRSRAKAALADARQADLFVEAQS